MFLNKIDNIEFELTTLCNARCPMCSRQVEETCNPDKSIPQHSITYKQIKNLELPYCDLTISGNFGDPIANPDALLILENLSKRVRSIGIDTNASLRNKEFWTELGKLGITVNFSIDGLEDTNHIYRVNTNFDKIMENAQAYIDAGGKAIWKFIAFEHNEHQIEEAELLSKLMKFDGFKVEHSTRWLSKSFNVNDYIIAPSRLALENEHKFKYNVIEGNDISCRSQNKNTLFITADFKLMPCCYFNVDRWKKPDEFNKYWDKVLKDNGKDFNDLNRYSIDQILRSDYYQSQLINSWSDGSCWKTCKRLCNSTSYWNKKEIRNGF